MRIIVVAAITALFSCATSTSEPDSPHTATESSEILGVTPTCACDAVQVTSWTVNTTSQYWVFNSNNIAVNNMHVILTASDPNGTDANYFYAWGIANGFTVGWLYKVQKSDYNQFVNQVVTSFLTKTQPGSSRFWGIAGGTPGGPTPIGPGGGDPIFVSRVQRTVGTIIDTERATYTYDAQTFEK